MNTERKWRVLVADDHETVRKGVCSILQSRKDLELCGEASDGHEAIQQARELKPDLIILDITMPGLDGFGAAKQIRQFLPGTPILILSMHSGRELANAAKSVGAMGFVGKNEAGTTLLKAVDSVLVQKPFFPE